MSGHTPQSCPKCGVELHDDNTDSVTIRDQQGKRHTLYFCEIHASTANGEQHLENIRSESGLECVVCHKPLLSSEADHENGEVFCSNHTYEQYRQKIEAEREQVEEMWEEEGTRMKEQYENDRRN